MKLGRIGLPLPPGRRSRGLPLLGRGSEGACRRPPRRSSSRLRADDITAITLVFPDREIGLRKQDGTWRLTKPIEAPADDAAVKSLLGTLTGAEIQKSLDELPPDLAAFGLDQPVPGHPPRHREGRPALHRRRQERGRRRQDLRAPRRRAEGPAGPLVHQVRARQAAEGPARQAASDVQGRRRHAHRRSRRPRARRSPSCARTRTPGSLEPGGAAHRHHGGPVLSLVACAPPAPSTSRTTRSSTGLDKPRLTVTVGLGTAPSQSLLIGNDITEGSQKQVFAKRADQPTVVTLGDWSFRTLGKDAWQFRDKTVLGFERRPGRPHRLRAQGRVRRHAGARPARRLDGRRREAVQGRRHPAFRRRPARAQGLVDRRGAGERSLKQFGLDAPDLRFTVVDREQKPLGTVLLTKHDGKYFAVREGGTTVFEVRDYMYTRLDKQLRDFVGPETPTATKPPAGDDAPPPGRRSSAGRRRAARRGVSSSAAAARQLWRPIQRCGDSRLRRFPISVRSWATSSRMSSSARRPTSRPPAPTTGRRRNRPERM